MRVNLAVNRFSLCAARMISRSEVLNRLADSTGMFIKRKLLPSYVLGGLRELAAQNPNILRAKGMHFVNIDSFKYLRAGLADKFNEQRKYWSDARINLRFADLTGADVSHVRFENVDLEGTNFTGAMFIDTVFNDCDLSKAIGIPTYIRERFGEKRS